VECLLRVESKMSGSICLFDNKYINTTQTMNPLAGDRTGHCSGEHSVHMVAVLAGLLVACNAAVEA
jgi:hypothetical protein